MGILSSAYTVLKRDIYGTVPAVQCRACGSCCVSPHMTLIEFCYLMSCLGSNPAFLTKSISRTVPEHPDYPGHFVCRFQADDGLCGVYAGRSLACRLHGHPVLADSGMQYHVHCSYGAAMDESFSADQVYGLLDRLTHLNQGYYSYYTQPYWVAGLTAECWLTILCSDFKQPVFQLLRKIMCRELEAAACSLRFDQHVRLQEKLELIDCFQSALAHGSRTVLLSVLQRIQDDFPDTGAYYYFEAEMYSKALDERQQATAPPPGCRPDRRLGG